MKVIVGLGKTGLSCARYFEQQGVSYAVMDHAPDSANIQRLAAINPAIPVTSLDRKALCAADEIVLSPGVPLSTPEIQDAIGAGVKVTGDVAMFSELADAPIVGITGSNGKSTVTALVGEMAAKAGADAGVGGNIGTPCLDLLGEDHKLYVLEISSYQLEVVDAPSYRVACLLNLTPDHLDRYSDAEHYYRTKARIFNGCETAVVGGDIDFPLDLSGAGEVVTFGSRDCDFGILTVDQQQYLGANGAPVLCVSELPIKGGHNYLNALAALAIGSSLGWEMDAMVEALREFRGLPHRCEMVGEFHGAYWINDSKATNIGATEAALKGIGPEHPGLILILGGQGKGADFSALSEDVGQYVGHLYVYGADRKQIASQLGERARVFTTLDEVVRDIAGRTQQGDLVLFSPGCASLDQYTNFEARGDAFRSLAMGSKR